jgi:hypothetical protein
MKQRVLNFLVAIDQLLYVIITLGNGNPDETMSAAAWRLEQAGRWQGKIFRPLIDTLFWFDPDHSKRAFEYEVSRRYP